MIVEWTSVFYPFIMAVKCPTKNHIFKKVWLAIPSYHIMPLQLQEQLILINFTIYIYFTEAFWIYKTPDISLFLHACSMPECNYHSTIFCNICLYFELNHEMKLKISTLSLFCVNFKTKYYFSNKITCHLHPIRQ